MNMWLFCLVSTLISVVIPVVSVTWMWLAVLAFVPFGQPVALTRFIILLALVVIPPDWVMLVLVFFPSVWAV